MCGGRTAASSDRQSCWLRPSRHSYAAQVSVDPVPAGLQDLVDAPQVQAHRHREEDHDDGRRVDLFLAGPRDAAHFVADLGQEAPRAPPPAGHAVACASAKRIVGVDRDGFHFLGARGRRYRGGSLPPIAYARFTHSPPPARSVPLAQPAAPPFFPGACARSVTGYQLPVSCSPGLAASGTTGNALLSPGYWQLAGQEGIEPPTPGFGDRCSANGATVLYLPRGFAPRTPLHALSRPTSQCASFAWLASLRSLPSPTPRAGRGPSFV